MEGLTIRSEAGTLIPLRFAPSQEILWQYVAPRLDIAEQAIKTGERSDDDKLWFIVLKGRQVYATTFFEALTFVRTIEKPNTKSLIIAHDLYTAAEVFGMARRFYDHLPLPKMKPPRVKEIEFPFPEGGSHLKVFSAGTMGKGRGTNQSCVHASEVAFWPRPEVLIGVFQAVPDLPDTVWVLESTANGMVGIGQTFYEQWKAAIDGRSKLTPIFVPWFIMPKYRMSYGLPESEWDEDEKVMVEQWGEYGLDANSLAWRRFMIDTKLSGSREMFSQEYPTTPEEAFITTGLPAFDKIAVLKQQKYVREPVLGMMHEGKFTKAAKGYLHLWREPEEGHKYAIGVDTSEGIKGPEGSHDYACAQVLDMETMEQVAMIHGFVQPWEMAHQLTQLGKWYKNAIVAIEVASSGWAVQDYMIRVFMYPNLHLWRGRADQVKAATGKLFGWSTNVQSRPLLIEAGRRAINSGSVMIHDRSTLDEISHFSRSDTGKYEASGGHDDRVIALLIALRSREENFHGATRIYTPEYSLSQGLDHYGVRVLHAADEGYLERRKIHQLVNKRARKALKDWMSL